MLRNQKGMTLIEIMIVLVILGTLAAYLGTKVSDSLGTAKKKEAQILIGEVSKAVERFNLDCNFYPSQLEDLMQPPSSGRQCPNWGPKPYMKKLHLDPWSYPLEYRSNGSDYEIISFGADGEQGGDGDNADISSNG